jgi:hypothetical protein
MLHPKLNLSRRRLDVSLLSDQRQLVEQAVAPPRVDDLRSLVARLTRHRQLVRADMRVLR